MGLFSFLQGSSATEAPRAGTPDPVQAARARARRRLIGAAVLLGAGVIGFPVLFETQPRPIPVDIAIDIPRKEGAPSLPLPPPRTASAAAATTRVSSGVIGERSAEPKRDAAAPVPVTPPRNESASPRNEPATNSAAATKPPAKPETRNDDGARARALLEGQSQASASSPTAAKQATVVAAAEPNKPIAAAAPQTNKPEAANGRFVVQVGAYGEATSARDMRLRVDKLGLKSYTQVIEIDGAKRIRVRVGPFVAREEAERVAGTLKAAGLPAAVLTL
jgi:DedD protein